MAPAPDERAAGAYVHVANVVVRHPETGEIALVRNKGSWWIPGGRVEPGETFAEAGCREVAEETGLDVEIIGVLGIDEEIHDDRHIVFVTLAGRVLDGDLRPPVDDPKIDAVRWVDLDQARNLLLDHPARQLILEPGVPVPHQVERP